MILVGDGDVVVNVWLLVEVLVCELGKLLVV